jgi:hypothetical protein
MRTRFVAGQPRILLNLLHLLPPLRKTRRIVNIRHDRFRMDLIAYASFAVRGFPIPLLALPATLAIEAACGSEVGNSINGRCYIEVPFSLKK